MAYVLVMGGLVLSVCFALGWAVVASGRWLWRRRPGGRQPARKASSRPKPRPRANPKPKSSPKPARQPRSRKTPEAAAKTPREPWRLTRWLARRHSALPLALLMALLYGFTRLAEYGMTHRPQEAPGGFHDLVSWLGWLAAGLGVLALLSLLAQWRCREA